MSNYHRVMNVALLATSLAVSMPAYAQDASETEMTERITPDEVQAEISEAFAKISDYTVEQRDEALEATRANMKRIDAEFEMLENRARENWADTSQAARDRMSKALQTLRERRNRLSEMYGAMSQGTGSVWDELVSGVGRAWEELEPAWDDAVSEANSDSGK